ncbi:MAG: hydroxypyruvate reductase [Betaproteobacteria bacterium RIFCSPLOWO2_12_FULL_68_20]|nr:MAG: hydroxypyruvate reductase [Betaproteobacteria bacterium RIFCSPLOWO2_12_FULL_68_20]
MRELLQASWRAAVAAADPLQILPPHLPQPPRGRTFVAAAGKAAASMALATERTWPKNRDLEGLAITRYRHGLPTRRIRVVEAGHPVPDEAGEAAARELLDRVRTLGEDDLLLALISGGGSSLLPLPAPGVAMSDLKTVTGQLLRSGASIQEINTVRKHLSAILGGRLAAASRARVLALIISDVTGDDPSDIASGPCAPDPTTCDDARAILLRYGIAPPGAFSESPKPGDPAFAKAENRVVATARRSLEAGCEVFRARGIEPVNLGDRITGEAREVAAGMAARVRTTRGPAALISGGECTVTVRGAAGRGGRCAEFLLALAIELDGMPGAYAIAADTDGIDGTEDNAGALIAPDTLARARAAGLDARAFLEANDSYGFFSALGDLVVTGPTRTNVNDYRAIVMSRG